MANKPQEGFERQQEGVLSVANTACPECGSTEFEMRNYSMMWHDGDIHCAKCLDIFVQTSDNLWIHAWLTMRPPYCDRGHIQLNIDGPLALDFADSFPRYFFSFPEADAHTRAFLKWRLMERADRSRCGDPERV